MRKIGLLLMLFTAMILAACEPTGDTSTDANAAQQLMPNINGYTVNSSDSLVDAIGSGAAGAALASGNVPLAATINRAEVVVECLRDRGAADLRTYIETSPQLVVPEIGAVFIVNNDRLNQNLLSCIAEAASPGFGAQAVTDPPCAESGTFTYEGDNYTFIYIGAGGNLCGLFNQHFTSLGATIN